MRRVLSILVLLGAILAAVGAPLSSAETVIVRGDFSYVGEVVSSGCGETFVELTVYSGEEHQASRYHYNRDGSLVWMSGHQTHSSMKAVSAGGEIYILQEVDNGKEHGNARSWVGHEFIRSVGADKATFSVRIQIVYRVEWVDGVGDVVEFDHINATCTP